MLATIVILAGIAFLFYLDYRETFKQNLSEEESEFVYNEVTESFFHNCF